MFFSIFTISVMIIVNIIAVVITTYLGYIGIMEKKMEAIGVVAIM